MSSKAVMVVDGSDQEVVELKDPVFAAVLAWLIPGLGHLYQGRTAKGILFMVSILGTFFFGLFCSSGHAVYASWIDWDRRLPYLCQVGVGLPALPALPQNFLVRNGRAPLAGGIMAPPATAEQLNDWYRELNKYFELGTVYTMIAGLLNILAIYDAWGGPVPIEDDRKKKKKNEPDEDSQPPPSD